MLAAQMLVTHFISNEGEPDKAIKMLSQLNILNIISSKDSSGSLTQNVLHEQITSLVKQLQSTKSIKSHNKEMMAAYDKSKLITVPSDGDCFFNALRASLEHQRSGEPVPSVWDLRKDMAEAYYQLLGEDPNFKTTGPSHTEKVVYTRILTPGMWNFDEFDWLVSVLGPRVIKQGIWFYGSDNTSVGFAPDQSDLTEDQAIKIYLDKNAQHYFGIKP